MTYLSLLIILITYMQFLCKHIKIRTREPSKVVVKKGNSIAFQQNTTRIHQPLQNPHNSSDTQPVELVIGALQVDCLRLPFFGKN